MNQPLKTVILFESGSLVRALICWRMIRRSSAIYYYDFAYKFSPLDQWSRTLGRRLTDRLIRLINAHVEIKMIHQEILAQNLWTTNKEAPHLVDQLEDSLRCAPAYKLFSSLIGDEQVLKYYKSKLVLFIARKRLFWKVAKRMREENPSLRLVTSAHDFHPRETNRAGSDLQLSIPPQVRFYNKTAGGIRKLFHIFILLLFPIFFLLSKLRRFCFRVQKNRYLVRLPVAWGFSEKPTPRPYDDAYLYNENIQPGHIIHVFGSSWNFAEPVKEKYRTFMSRHGMKYTDEKTYRMPLRLVGEILRLETKLLLGATGSFFFLRESGLMLVLTALALRDLLKKSLELENIDFAVELNKEDYNASHIISTIVNRQRGISTIGVHHCSSPHDSPQLCYVHFDKYVVYAPNFVKWFDPYWRDLELCKISRETIDWIATSSESRRNRSLRGEFEKIYGKRSQLLMVAFPGDIPRYMPDARWQIFYEGLAALSEFPDLDAHVLLRFKYRESVEESPNLRRLSSLPERDKRFIIDWDTFSTYELMSIADIFIGANCSISLHDALAGRAKVFTFNIHHRARLIFRDYGKDFILENPDDFRRLFQTMRSGNFDDYQCKWDQLKADSNYRYDNQNRKRLQEAVWQMARGRKEGLKCTMNQQEENT